MKNFILPIIVSCALIFTSCNSDDDNGNENNEDNCQTLSQDALDAGTAWGVDATNDNCNAYKSALQALLDNDCLEGTAVISTQGVIDGLNCSE